MPNPGRRPFEVASPGTGVFTEVDSTQAMHRSLAVPCRTRTADSERCQEHRLERVAPLLLGGLQHRSGGWAADADQCAIEPTEGIQREGAGRLGGAGIGQVGRERDGRSGPS